MTYEQTKERVHTIAGSLESVRAPDSLLNGLKTSSTRSELAYFDGAELNTAKLRVRIKRVKHTPYLIVLVSYNDADGDTQVHRHPVKIPDERSRSDFRKQIAQRFADVDRMGFT